MIKPYRNVSDWHAESRTRPHSASRVTHSLNKERFFLDRFLSFLYKVYSCVPKVISSLSKTLLTARAMRHGGV